MSLLDRLNTLKESGKSEDRKEIKRLIRGLQGQRVYHFTGEGEDRKAQYLNLNIEETSEGFSAKLIKYKKDGSLEGKAKPYRLDKIKFKERKKIEKEEDFPQDDEKVFFSGGNGPETTKRSVAVQENGYLIEGEASPIFKDSLRRYDDLINGSVEFSVAMPTREEAAKKFKERGKRATNQAVKKVIGEIDEPDEIELPVLEDPLESDPAENASSLDKDESKSYLASLDEEAPIPQKPIKLTVKSKQAEKADTLTSRVETRPDQINPDDISRILKLDKDIAYSHAQIMEKIGEYNENKNPDEDQETIDALEELLIEPENQSDEFVESFLNPRKKSQGGIKPVIKKQEKIKEDKPANGKKMQAPDIERKVQKAKDMLMEFIQNRDIENLIAFLDEEKGELQSEIFEKMTEMGCYDARGNVIEEAIKEAEKDDNFWDEISDIISKFNL